jgi:hypothetical protein
MIYLAIHQKVFGPFPESELTPEVLQEYRWIYRTREAQKGWQPIDPVPSQLPAPGARETQAIATVAEMQTAVSGRLQEIRARKGWLESREHGIRLSVGSPIRLQLMGPAMRQLSARVEKVETSSHGVRYLLSWDPVQAP